MVNDLRPHPPEALPTTDPVHQILMPLLYFEIFSYPLTKSELIELCAGDALTEEELNRALVSAQSRGWIKEQQGYYSLHGDPTHISARIDHNARAERYIRHAYRMTRLIRRFPFVRAVFLSGALSKNVMPRDGDIDYFIITKPGRLWVSRTLLILFKKIFLFNSHKYFCVNYFVDTSHLLIEEQNQFTATEVATLVPLYNHSIYQGFMDHNQWVKKFYPNFPTRSSEKTLRQRRSNIQQLMEYVLNGRLGNWLEDYFFQKTLKFWQKKFANFDPGRFSNALKSRPHVSKHHPQDFQHRVLTRLEELTCVFEAEHQVKLARPFAQKTAVQTEK